MKSYLQKIKYAVCNFREDIPNNLAVIIPALVVMTMVISWIVSFVMFIVSRGYSSQIDIIKSNGFGFDAVSEAFTNGTVHILYGKMVTSIVITLLVVQAALFLRSYFRESTKIQRITMIIDPLIVGFSAVGMVLMLYMYEGKIKLSEKQILFVSGIMDSSNGPVIKTVLIVIFIAALISFSILILKSNNKWILGHGSLAAILVYTVLPLLLLLVENIVPLFAGILIVALIGAVIWFIFAFLSGNGNSSSHQSPRHNSCKPEKKKVDKNCEYVDRGIGGIKLYRVHGVTHDYVEKDNIIATKEVCSLYDLRKSNFHIYDKATGKIITENEIPWRK